jgi:hypothetical protein
MYQNAPKASLISEMHSLKGTAPGSSFIALLDILINETRRENDTVNAIQLPVNQGKIEAYSQLKDYIERGSPGQR